MIGAEGRRNTYRQGFEVEKRKKYKKLVTMTVPGLTNMEIGIR